MCLCYFYYFKKVFFFQQKVRHQKPHVENPCRDQTPRLTWKRRCWWNRCNICAIRCKRRGPDPAFVPTETTDLVSGSWITILQVLEEKKTYMNFVHFCNQCCVFCGDRMLGLFCLRYIWLYDVCVFVCFWFSSHVFFTRTSGCNLKDSFTHIFHEYTPRRVTTRKHIKLLRSQVPPGMLPQIQSQQGTPRRRHPF